MWAILTNPDKAGNKWGEDDFFKSGRNEIEVVFKYLKEYKYLPVDNFKALDFGCGVGRLSRALSSLFSIVDGIDVSPTMIAKANALNTDLNDKVFFFVNQLVFLKKLEYPLDQHLTDASLRRWHCFSGPSS